MSKRIKSIEILEKLKKLTELGGSFFKPNSVNSKKNVQKFK